MEYLAKKGIVHRDLAARNVLVRTIEHVEVTDFGLAAMLQRPGDSVVVEGRVAVKWLAPESLRQQIYNEWTDVWSFGVTCWEILTLGESPYKEWALPRECLARELADRLEKGHRLTIPDNCSSEFQQMLLNCRRGGEILNPKPSQAGCSTPNLGPDSVKSRRNLKSSAGLRISTSGGRPPTSSRRGWIPPAAARTN
jgi:serine/threonine protein kinase